MRKIPVIAAAIVSGLTLAACASNNESDRAMVSQAQRDAASARASADQARQAADAARNAEMAARQQYSTSQSAAMPPPTQQTQSTQFRNQQRK